MDLTGGLPATFDIGAAAAVFGPVNGATDLAEWSRQSPIRFVRNETHVARWSGRATGPLLTAWEALHAFGWPVMSGLEERRAVSFLSEGCQVSPLFKRRREAIGVTQADLAEHTGLDVEAVMRAESGKRLIPMPHLTAIAQALALDTWRIGADPVAGGDDRFAEMLRIMTTGSASLTARTRLDLAETAWLVATQTLLLSWIDPRAGNERENLGLGTLAVPDSANAGWEQGVALARAFRAKFGLQDSTPVESMTDLVERVLGLPLIRIPLEQGIGGAALRVLGSAGIVVNTRHVTLNAGPKRMTAAHELSHVLFEPAKQLSLRITGDPGSIEERSTRFDPIECRAQAFASELLIPAAEAGRRFLDEGGDADAIVSIARTFGVSYTAARIQTRLGLGRPREATLPSKPGQVEDRKWHESETPEQPYDIALPIQRSGRFSSLAVRAFRDNLISADTAAALLKTDKASFVTAMAPDEDPGFGP